MARSSLHTPLRITSPPFPRYNLSFSIVCTKFLFIHAIVRNNTYRISWSKASGRAGMWLTVWIFLYSAWNFLFCSVDCKISLSANVNVANRCFFELVLNNPDFPFSPTKISLSPTTAPCRTNKDLSVACLQSMGTMVSMKNLGSKGTRRDKLWGGKRANVVVPVRKLELHQMHYHRLPVLRVLSHEPRHNSNMRSSYCSA